MSNCIARALPLAALAAAFLGATAGAAPIFSQTPPSGVEGIGSDRSSDFGGVQVADDFTLSAPATVRSITWRGSYAGGNSPTFPLSFSVLLYGNDPNGLPDTANVQSATPIRFFSAGAITDTGIDAFGSDVYEFRADLTPTPLEAGATYWLSVLADTGNDADDNWFWLSGASNETLAVRPNVVGNGPFGLRSDGPVYFVLGDAAVPEPASIALLGFGGLALLRRRRVG